METHEYIKKLRVDAQLTQKALGDVIGRTITTISKYETGKMPISKPVFEQILKATNSEERGLWASDSIWFDHILNARFTVVDAYIPGVRARVKIEERKDESKRLELIRWIVSADDSDLDNFIRMMDLVLTLTKETE